MTVTILRETGARPLEVRTVDNRYFDRRAKCWVFPRSQSKGKRHPRVVMLNDKALEITKRYADQYKTGPIFRNGKGGPWSKSALTQRCERLAGESRQGDCIDVYPLRSKTSAFHDFKNSEHRLVFEPDG